MATPAVRPVRGPRWTQKRLVDMLIDCYGPSSRGPVDVAAVAQHAGVTPAAVRKWLRPQGGPPSRVRAGLPRARITQLQRARPDVEDANERRYQYALHALDMIERGQTIPPWQTQGWLDPQSVAIVAVNGKPWNQVVVTKANQRAMQTLSRRATVLQTVLMPNRFHAQVLAHHVMVRQQNWRVYPAESQLSIGRTQVWMAGAPPVDLEELATTPPTRTPQRPADKP